MDHHGVVHIRTLCAHIYRYSVNPCTHACSIVTTICKRQCIASAVIYLHMRRRHCTIPSAVAAAAAAVAAAITSCLNRKKTYVPHASRTCDVWGFNTVIPI